MNESLHHTAPFAVVSKIAPGALALRRFEDWIVEQDMGLVGPLPIALILSANDAKRVPDELAQILAHAQVPVMQANGKDNAQLLAQALADHIARQDARMLQIQAEMAAIRTSHEHLQRAFVTTENWLSILQTPKCVRALHIDTAGRRIELTAGQTVTQPLPVSTRGIIAVDLPLDGPGDIACTIIDAEGVEISPLSRLADSPQPGWQRFAPIAAAENLDRDARLQIIVRSGAISLGLGETMPDSRHCAVTVDGAFDAPLALTVWQGLPGTQPPMQIAAARTYLPISDLPEAVVFRGRVQRHPMLGAMELLADTQGIGGFVLRDVVAGRQGSLIAQVQALGPAGLTTTFMTTPAGGLAGASDLYRLPKGRHCPASLHTRLHATLLPDSADLVIRIEDCQPGASLWLWALWQDALSE